MKLKNFYLTVISIAFLLGAHVEAAQIEYTTDMQGNNAIISGITEPGNKLLCEVPEVYDEEIVADESGVFEFRFKLPKETIEYDYYLESLEKSAYFTSDIEDFNNQKEYTMNTGTRDYGIGYNAPSLRLDKESRFLMTYGEEVNSGLWSVSADFMVTNGNTHIVRITNSKGNAENIDEKINHLEENEAHETIRIDVRNGGLYIYYVDNNTNQISRSFTEFAKYEYGTWHNIELRINIDDGSFQVYLDGVRMLEDVPLYMAIQKDYGRLFDTSTSETTWYLDNVSVRKNRISGTLSCDSLKEVFYELKECKFGEFGEKLKLFEDYLAMNDLSEEFFEQTNIDRLYNRLKHINRISDLNKEIAVLDVLTSTDKIVYLIEKYPELFSSFGVYDSIIESPQQISDTEIAVGNDFVDVVKQVNAAYDEKKKKNIQVTNYLVENNKVSFDIKTEESTDVKIRILDDDYEVINKIISLTGGTKKTYSTELPKNGKDKRYLLVIESENYSGVVYQIDVAGMPEAYNMFYKDDTSEEVDYQFENTSSVFTVEKRDNFGHGAPSRFIDINKRFIVNPKGVFTKGYYVASADIYVNTCNSIIETDLIRLFNNDGSKLGARLFLKNNCLMLQCEDVAGEIVTYGIMIMTLKQWYNISFEITPDLRLNLYIDGKAILADVDKFLDSNCKNGLRMMNIDTRNTNLSLYIDNITLYEDYMKEKIDFNEVVISSDSIDLVKEINGERIYWTSSQPEIIDSNGVIYCCKEDYLIKLTVVGKNTQTRVYYVRVSAADDRNLFDLKNVINFSIDKLPVYTTENQKIEWTLLQDDDNLIYKAYVKELELECEYYVSKEAVYNKRLTNDENRITFSAEYNTSLSYCIYMAAYDNEGRLLSVVKNNTCDIPDNADYLKVFVWEEESIRPMTDDMCIYNFSPEKIYLILGNGKSEQSIDNISSDVYIADVNNLIWSNTDDMLTSLGVETGGAVGFIDARDCDDVGLICNIIKKTNAEFMGAIYLNKHTQKDDFAAIKLCELLDEIQTSIGSFTTVAPQKPIAFYEYNQMIKAVSEMRSDFVVVISDDVELENEIEYSKAGLNELGKRIMQNFYKGEEIQ